MKTVTKQLNFTKILALILFISIATSRQKDEATPGNNENSVKINGEDYSTVKIGDQIWTTENYHGVGGIPYNDKNEKPEYGRYYTFEEAETIVLPAGWRIPTIEDFVKLAESQGVKFTNRRATDQNQIKKLASKTRWLKIAGNNESGFNAYPAGYSFKNSAPMDGDISEFWTSDAKSLSIQEGAKGINHNMGFYDNSADRVDYRFNLRFVKDDK